MWHLMNPQKAPVRDYGTYLRSVYKSSLDERFATASVKDLDMILSCCEQAAREGKTEHTVAIDTQVPQDKYNAFVCDLLHEMNLDALPETDGGNNKNYRHVRVVWL